MMRKRDWARATAGAALGVVALGLPMVAPGSAFAQGAGGPVSNIIPEPMAEMIRARIKAIDPQTRQLTLTGESGREIKVTAGPAVRLEMLKTGDTVTARFYRSVAFMLSSSSNVPQDEVDAILARPVQAPGGAALRVTRVSGLVVGMHRASNSLDVVDPSGGIVHTIHVTDPSRIAMLGEIKVGDTITAVISEALAVSVEPA